MENCGFCTHFIILPSTTYLLKKAGERPEGLSDSTSFFKETFGTVFLVPEKLRLIGNLRD